MTNIKSIWAKIVIYLRPFANWRFLVCFGAMRSGNVVGSVVTRMYEIPTSTYYLYSMNDNNGSVACTFRRNSSYTALYSTSIQSGHQIKVFELI